MIVPAVLLFPRGGFEVGLSESTAAPSFRARVADYSRDNPSTGGSQYRSVPGHAESEGWFLGAQFSLMSRARRGNVLMATDITH
jgi:hypothetical protein